MLAVFGSHLSVSTVHGPPPRTAAQGHHARHNKQLYIRKLRDSNGNDE